MPVGPIYRFVTTNLPGETPVANDQVRYDGRTVLVTGGGRGIGRAQALLLAARGARVVVADSGTALNGEQHDDAPAHAVAAEIRSAGGIAAACTADLSDEAGSHAAVQAALDNFGRIDAIAHNASTSPDLSTAEAMSTHDLEVLMRVNPMAALWMGRAAWPHMAAAGFGRIVLTSSAGIYGSFGNAHYAAAKAAYLGIVSCLALEGAPHGILVNAIAPSARTRMTERLHDTPYSRWLFETMSPEHVAVGAAYLLSEACGVSGETFSLGGGRIARIRLAETEGVLGAGAAIEQVAAAMPAVMADERMFLPASLSERSARVAELFGFDGGLDASAAIAVKPL